ncbi:MAG: 50S ribosomal protein L6 [Verrucomicrobiota bacterium]|nr:50S ribosomal protein L6 [Verrucomicrobiota bacterium]
MSRLGAQPIKIAGSVKVTISGRLVKVEGPKGTLDYEVPENISVNEEDGQIIVSRKGDDKKAKSMHGLAHSLINNMIIGVSNGFKKQLEIRGVGYKVKMGGDTLELNVGFSHSVKFKCPDGITITTPNQTNMIIEGYDKHLVGQTAASIRGIKPPEPYKGKGIRYLDEYVAIKEGKKIG